MEQRKKLTNQLKVSQILALINKNLRWNNRGTASEMHFYGKIDAGLTFTIELTWDPNQPGWSDSRMDIDLKNYKKDLATIIVEHTGYLGFYGKLFDNQNYNHDIKILTPNWYGKTGVKTDLTEKGQAGQLQVWHEQNRSAVDVINKIYKLVDRSITKDKVTQKLAELNLPDLQLRAATEYLVNLICDDQPQNNNRSKDNNRGRNNGRGR